MMTATTINVALAILAYLLGVMTAVSAAAGRQTIQRVSVIAGWIGLLAVAGLTALGTTGGPGALLAGGAFGAIASIPMRDIGESLPGRLIVPLATVATLGVCSMAAELLFTVDPWPAATTVYVVLFAGMAGAVSLFGTGAFRGWSVVSEGPDEWIRRLTAGVIVAAGPVAATGGLWLTRGPSAPSGGIPLVGEGGRSLVWSLPSGIEQLSVRSFPAITALPEWVMWLGGGVAGLCLFAALVERLEHGVVVRTLWGVVGLLILGSGAGLALWADGAAQMPDAAEFVSRAEVLLSRAELPQRVAEQGGFSSAGARPDWIGLLPLGGALLWSGFVCFGLALIGRGSEPERDVRRPSVPSVRACLVLWACWFVAGLIHWRLAGVVGFQSASEWVGLGVSFIATGASLVALGRAPAAGSRMAAQARLSTGAAVALVAILAGLTLAVWTGTPMFLSIPA